MAASRAFIYDWSRRHWFSPGYDEKQAEQVRAQVCQAVMVGALARYEPPIKFA
jgi:hypothetical protein